MSNALEIEQMEPQTCVLGTKLPFQIIWQYLFVSILLNLYIHR